MEENKKTFEEACDIVRKYRLSEDMTYEETAKALGISSSAVNKHITRSLGKIRSILKIAR